MPSGMSDAFCSDENRVGLGLCSTRRCVLRPRSRVQLKFVFEFMVLESCLGVRQAPLSVGCMLATRG